MPEKYQVLARRYRPQKFSDVVGQEAILQTLRNAILKNTIAHAYLFSGSRGIGKTTLARLFAKALNCNQIRDQIEPCNSCPSCLDILSGRALDVIEIDGASNRGIDDIRQINETIGFVPTHGKYKIILIDEVHMLTKEAFNALLKTLEEPPENAKFFFATTEPHKVLPTILSRCQRFDLSRLSIALIIKKLDSIAKDMQRDCEEEALQLIAQASDGSLRDAESLFDQILCFSNEIIRANDVRKVLGLSPQDLFFELDSAFSQSKFEFAFELVDQLYQSGKDLAHFLEQLLEHYRNITVCSTRGASFLSLSQELKNQYQKAAETYTQSQCLSILDLLIKTESQFSKSISPRITLEMTLLQILRMKMKIPIEVLVRRLSDLEESLLTHQKNATSEDLTTSTEQPQLSHPVTQSEPQNLKVQEVQPDLKAAALEDNQVPSDPVQKINELKQSLISKPIIDNDSKLDFHPPSPPLNEPKSIKEKPVVSKNGSSPPLSADEVAEKKHQSHYDTLIRFAAVELEGSVNYLKVE